MKTPLTLYFSIILDPGKVRYQQHFTVDFFYNVCSILAVHASNLTSDVYFILLKLQLNICYMICICPDLLSSAIIDVIIIDQWRKYCYCIEM